MADPNTEITDTCNRSAAPSALKDPKNRITHADVGGLDVRLHYRGYPPYPAAPGSSDDELKKFIKQLSPETSRKVNVRPDCEALVHPFVRNMNYFSSVYGAGYGKLQFIGWSDSYRNPLRCDGTEVNKDGSIEDVTVHCEIKNGKPVYYGTEIIIKDGDLKRSYHYHGRALDIVWFAWEGSGGVPIYCRPIKASEDASDPTAHRRLVAVEAGLRKWFGYVLNRGIKNHADHFHVDNGCPLALRVRKDSDSWVGMAHTSCHYFLQDCIWAFTDEKPDYDGAWGPASKHGYKTLLSDLGMECLNPAKYVNHYMLFLDYIMMHGFADKPAGAYRWGGNAVVL